jgi:hypothetical protein
MVATQTAEKAQPHGVAVPLTAGTIRSRAQRNPIAPTRTTPAGLVAREARRRAAASLFALASLNVVE